MIAMSVVLIKVYFDINKKNIEKEDFAPNIIFQQDDNIAEFEIFENEDKLLGVNDKNNRVIIEPSWENIYILSRDRFIISRMFDGVKKMGIIDHESNIIVPLIFDDFKSLNNDFIGGFTGINNEFFLFDKTGNLITNKTWTSFKYSDQIIYLNYEEDEYRGKIVDDKFQYIYLYINKKVDDISFNITITETEKINKIGIDNINRVADITEGYLSYLNSGDINEMSDLTSEQYFKVLSSNDFFKDCTINNISDFDLECSEEKSKLNFNVKIKVNYNYKKKDIVLKDISSEITFNIIKDENNRLILKSINKTEL